jgi:hypothetical protein
LNTACDIWVTTLLVYMHPTFTSAVANTRLHGELVLHFTTLLEQRRLYELYLRMESRWISGEVTLYFTVGPK